MVEKLIHIPKERQTGPKTSTEGRRVRHLCDAGTKLGVADRAELGGCPRCSTCTRFGVRLPKQEFHAFSQPPHVLPVQPQSGSAPAEPALH